MVRSERTTRGFFQERVGEGAQSVHERVALGRVEALERLAERTVARVDPRLDERAALVVELEHGAAAVGLVLAAADEPVLLQVARELARGGEGEAELAGELADRPAALAGDGVEQGDVPAAERRVAAEELGELRREAVPAAQAPHDAAQRAAERLGVVAAHLITVIIE
jgi:hypothetical protein